jgi:hypothetical protein
MRVPQGAPGATDELAGTMAVAYWALCIPSGVAGPGFVTAIKHNATLEVIEAHAPPHDRGILRGQTIELTGAGGCEKCPQRLRRSEAVREDTGERLVFLTYHHGLGAPTVAAIYRDRWAAELFDARKQNLKIENFAGTSTNAVRTWIRTAPISMLLLRDLQHSSPYGWSLSNLAVLLRMNLFSHRDLMAGSTNRLPHRSIRSRCKARWHSPDVGRHVEARS